MSWDEVLLADAPLEIIDGDRGKNYPKQDDFYSEEFCLFLSATNVTKEGFKFESCQFITEAKDSELRKGKLKRNDVVMTTRGTIGNIGYYSDKISYENVRINSGMVIIRVNTEKYYAPFLYYFLRSEVFNTKVNLLRSGAAQPQLPIRDMKNIHIPYPSIKEQKRIAAYISAYDDLIDNNRRRIQLLEDSARLLYREWFVHLRFPGHEHVKIVEGVPDGWSRKSIKECCKKISYGYTASAAVENIGPKFLRITDIVPNTINWDSVPYCPINDEDKKKYLLEEGDIVVARTGATVGYAKRIAKLDFDVVYASYLVKFKPDTQIIDDLILGIFMESDEYKNFVRSNAGGAAQPNANAQVLAAADLLIPVDNIQKLFREYTHRLILQKQNLEKQISSLIKARDLLLPRLMSGTISV